MNDKQLYQQKVTAQLAEWAAEVDKLKAQASGASAQAQLAMKTHVAALEKQIAEGKNKLAEMTAASADAWESTRNGAESALEVIKKTFAEAYAKVKG